MFEWIFYPWMISNSYTLLIIYARVDITPIYIACLSCLLIVEEVIYQGVGNLYGDLLQQSGIRYEFWSFSVRYLISLAYWKWLIYGVKLFVVVPQDIGIYLCNSLLPIPPSFTPFRLLVTSISNFTAWGRRRRRSSYRWRGSRVLMLFI